MICGSLNSTHLPKSVQQLAVAEIGEGEEEERNPWRLCSPRWRAAFCSAHTCHPGAAGGVNFAFWSLVWSASSLCIHLICFDLIDVFFRIDLIDVGGVIIGRGELTWDFVGYLYYTVHNDTSDMKNAWIGLL